MQSEEQRAPWNTKKIRVDISQTLSFTTEIEVPLDFDETDNFALGEEVKNQIILPSDFINWTIDDFCVM